MNEKVYKIMGGAGASNIAIGIIVMTTGIVTGILMMIQGARLLKSKKNVLL